MYGLRETRGRFFTSVSPMTRPRAILPGSATGASPLTETTSWTPPTSSAKFSTAVWPALRPMPVRSTDLNPDSSTLTR